MNLELDANGVICRGDAEVPRRLAAERAPSDRGAALWCRTGRVFWTSGRLAVLDCRASFAMYNTRAEVDNLPQALLKSAEIFHMVDEAKTAGTESAPPTGAGAAASAADAAERPPTIPADEMARLTDEIVAALKTVYDPEIPADLYELGLIYKVDMNDDRMVTIDMTLTSPNCPSAAELPGQVENAVAGVSGVREAKVNIVWDPPWDPSRMSDEARTELNMW